MQNIFKKNTNILLVAAIASCLLLSLYLWIQEKNIASVDDLQNSGGGKISRFEEMKAELPALSEKDNLIKRVLDSAKRNNLRIIGGNYKEDLVKGSHVSKISYSCSFAGGYSHIKKFIFDIEKMKDVLTVEDLALEKKKEDVELTIFISAFFK